MKFIPCFLLGFLLQAGVTHAAPPLMQEDDKTLIKLTGERTKLQRQTNPVDRAKTGIKVSELLLTLVSGAVRKGDLELMATRLNEYTATITDAHETLVKTGRNAHSKPSGFKDLEIALRRQMRQLDDLGGALSFDERSPVTRARTVAADIRDAILKAMFGGQNNAPSVRS